MLFIYLENGALSPTVFMMTKILQGGNSNLHQAKKEKNDEFYTQLVDIENELKYYKQHFKGKIVFCNCDDPYESNFFKYFVLNFERLELKKLIGMGYATSQIVGKEVPLFDIEWYEEPRNKAYKIEVHQVQDFDWNGAFDLNNIQLLLKKNKDFIKISPLKWNDDFFPGDFRSAASIATLKEADIVVTNPPFSLFREYVEQLMYYKKQFLIVGNQNAITYKEIFPLIKNNELWLGCKNGSQEFKVPENFEKNNTYTNDNGEKMAKFGNIARFTNLEHNKRHEELILYKTYNPIEYPKYDNYDAIEVSKVKEIPYDYEGAMGVPITFLDKYNPDQFEVLGCSYSYGEPIGYHLIWKGFDVSINWKSIYKRLFIRKKQ